MISDLGSVALVTVLSAIIGRIRSRPNLSLEVRHGAYRDFRHAVLRAVLASDLWATTRPGILGAGWS